MGMSHCACRALGLDLVLALHGDFDCHGLVAQVDQAANMIERLLQPVDEERNEHKRMQLRELAALNGTLKDDQTCYLCGDSGHRSYECPKKAMDLYKLPLHIQEKVDELYQKDVIRVRPEEAGKLDNEYKSFLMEVGGGQAVEASCGASGADAGVLRTAGATQAQVLRSRRPGEDLPDDCKLYVGNLSMTFSDSMLRQLFEPFGKILHATVLMDLITGTSRGYGFVHFTNNVDSRRAAEEMNTKVVDGRALVVRLRSEGPPAQRPKYGAQEPDDAKLYVAHLPLTINEMALRSLFQRHGQVGEVKLITDRATGQVKGYGFVNMASPQAAQAAIQALNGYQLDGKTLTVRIAGQRPPGPPLIPSVAPITTQPSAPKLPLIPMGHSVGQPGIRAPIPIPMHYPLQQASQIQVVLPPALPSHQGAFQPPGVGGPQPRAACGLPPPPPLLPTQYNLAPVLAPQQQSYVFGQQYSQPTYSTPPRLPPQPLQEQPRPPTCPPPTLPPPPTGASVQSEYERFMQEMHEQLPT